MSHGPAAEETAEPNLMPLLNVVMQLLMFFILCADLKQANRKNPFIALPAAEAAVPSSPSGDGLIFVNIKVFNPADFSSLSPEIKATFPGLFPTPPPGGQSVCFICPATGNREPMNRAQFESWLQGKITSHANAAAAKPGVKAAELSVAVRAAGIIQYGYVLDTLQYCKKQNLKTVISVNTHQKGNS